MLRVTLDVTLAYDDDAAGDPGLGAGLQLALRGGRDVRLQPGPGGGRHALPFLRLPGHPRLEVWHPAPQGDKVDTAHLHMVEWC